ncbi:DUF4326 domain-containing protein [Streptomyces sp. SBT349]|uniref:DUF4326 domain-containing protein n=1 Tax=Streptomyces sp. SBT349 TaxID=1580539 RepID=UPI00066E46CD|nr:DUF4326 domain-containing protein [Streptomyces sp. SBT349]
MSAPSRIQRRRTPGARTPAAAVYVGRGRGDYGRWGNPFRIIRIGGVWSLLLLDGRLCGAHATKESAARAATEEFRAWVHAPEQSELLAAARSELAGRDLACWCAVGTPCHGGVWLTAVNAPTEVPSA